jgi:hypothetical protein
MGLENGKPLDYINDESGEKKSLYEDNKLVSADDYKGSLDDKADDIIAAYKKRIDALKEARYRIEDERNSNINITNTNIPSQVNEEFSDIASSMEEDFDIMFGDNITPDKTVPTLESDANIKKLKLSNNDKKDHTGFVSTLIISIITILAGLLIIVILYGISK